MIDREIALKVLRECHHGLFDTQEGQRCSVFGLDMANYEIDLSDTVWETEYGIHKVHSGIEPSTILFEVDLYAFKDERNAKRQKYNMIVEITPKTDEEVLIAGDCYITYKITSQDIAESKGVTNFNFSCGAEGSIYDEADFIDFGIEVVGGTYSIGKTVLDGSWITHFRNATFNVLYAELGTWDIKEYLSRNLIIKASEYRLDVFLSPKSHKLIMKLFDWFLESECNLAFSYMVSLRFLIADNQTNSYVYGWMKGHMKKLHPKYNLMCDKYNVLVSFSRRLHTDEEIEATPYEQMITIHRKGKSYKYRNEYLQYMDDIDGFIEYYCMN